MGVIKLETNKLAPSCGALLEIVSAGQGSSIVLGTTDHGAFVAEVWKSSVPGIRRQVVSFIGSDGQACSIEGPVDEDLCVEVSAAHKVVVEAKISNALTTTGAAGRKSKEYCALEVVRVVEVWDSPTLKIYPQAGQKPAAKGGRVMDASGKIEAA